MKKSLALLLALVMMFSLVLTACSGDKAEGSDSASNSSSAADESSKEESAEEKTEAETEKPTEAPAAFDAAEFEKNVYTFSNDTDNTVSLGTPATELDPENVYKSVTYVPEMFYGTYFIPSGDEADYRANIEYYKFNEAASSGGGVERQLTCLPFRLEGYAVGYAAKGGKSETLNILEGSFINKEGDNERRKFIYTVDSKAKTVTLKEIKDVDYDNDLTMITHYEEGQLSFTYGFAFKGTTLTLTNGDNKVLLRTGIYDGSESGTRITTSSHSYLRNGSDQIDKIISIDLYRNEEGSLHSIYIAFLNDKNEAENSYNCYGEMTETGLFTFSVPYASETKTYQYVYFYIGDGSLILTDGTTNYYYMAKEEDYQANK